MGGANFTDITKDDWRNLQYDFLNRKVPGLTDWQNKVGQENYDATKNIIARGTGRQAGYLDALQGGFGEGVERRRGFQDEYKGLTQGGGQEMVDRFKAGGAGVNFKPDMSVFGGYSPFSGGKGGGGGGGSFNWSGGGGGPSAASAEAVSEAKRFQDAFGQMNEQQKRALGIFDEGRGQADQFNQNIVQDTKYDKAAQDLFKKYEGQMTGRHEMDAKTAALFDELKGQMAGNQYQDEAAKLIRGTTGDIMIDQTTPQISAAKDLFNQTQGAQLTNQMAAAGLGRGGARADVEARAWATQLPSLIQNEQQFELAQRQAQRDAANQMFGMGQAESQRGLATFGAGQAANADIANRERGIQQALMGQGINMNMQQSQAQRAAMQAGYGAQAQALTQQAQAAMQAGDSEKARELNAQANLMQAFGMRSGSEDAAAARAASLAGQQAAAQSALEQQRMSVYGNMYGNQLNAYSLAEQRALDAMKNRQDSLENMFTKFDTSEGDIETDRQSMYDKLMGGNERMMTNALAGQQQAYDTGMDYGDLQRQALLDQFNYDTSEFDRLRALYTGGLEGSTAVNPTPIFGTRTAGGGKKG